MSLCINPNCPKPQNADNILFCEACGSELLLEGRYRIIRQLGEGGFGKTFEVSQSNVLKVLKVLILDDSKAVSLFQQEARVLSQLNHPGIPKAEGYFTFLPRNGQSPLDISENYLTFTTTAFEEMKVKCKDTQIIRYNQC
ncbi:MAG: 4-Cys prefix domain-containing protein, partial [Sphaerospermopsis kisseleviana]